MINPKSSNKSIRKVVWTLGRGRSLLILAAAAVAVGVIIYSFGAKPRPASQSDNLNLASYSYTGIESGAGLTFQKPTQFTLSSSNSNSLIKAFRWTNNGQTAGSIYVLSEPFAAGYSRQAALANAKGISQNPNSQSYQSAVLQPTLLARAWLANVTSTFVTQLQSPTAFRPGAFNGTAWQFLVSVSKLKKPNTTVMKGEFIHIVGNKADYYFGIAITPQKWQQDSSTWQQILNSLKVDQ